MSRIPSAPACLQPSSRLDLFNLISSQPGKLSGVIMPFSAEEIRAKRDYSARKLRSEKQRKTC